MEIKPVSLHNLFNKTQQEDVSNLNEDDTTYPTLIQQSLNKQYIVSLQLLRLPENKTVSNTPFKIYNAQTHFFYNFIHDFLYPKHVFW
ncbi:hypothetical protein [Pedobacter lusitanus]|uniref:hypothetical protein n=1 Tax=Pedobacter lusitanus TaxID=1503925 RepID=UPI000B0E75F9|nr:hypothetical protein [Pedobacter lusitanus]